jgi:hypothetical protein
VRTGLDSAGAPRLVLVVVASAAAALAYAGSIYRLAPATSSAVQQMAALMRQRT